MGRKCAALVSIVIFLGVLLLSGCETTKGVANGIGEGVSKDSKAVCGWVKKADTWIKDNLW